MAKSSKSEMPKLEIVDPVAPVVVGNPDAAGDLAIDQEHLEEYVNAAFESSVVECRKPGKGIFFAVRAETGKPWQNRGFYFLLEMEGRDPYIVTPAIAKQKSEEDTIRPVLLVRYVTMGGDEGLWPLKLDRPDGKVSPWNSSAIHILEFAESIWVRMMNAKKHYRHQKSKKTFEEVPPQFTKRTFKELVNIAFKDRVIDSLDHEIWDVLDNGSAK
jgi:hypothetical protein